MPRYMGACLLLTLRGEALLRHTRWGEARLGLLRPGGHLPSSRGHPPLLRELLRHLRGEGLWGDVSGSYNGDRPL
jgi:hypothetical protein